MEFEGISSIIASTVKETVVSISTRRPMTSSLPNNFFAVDAVSTKASGRDKGESEFPARILKSKSFKKAESTATPEALKLGSAS
ncbi:hypothetical protein D3C81_1016980 [compost metagenome]